MAHTFRGLMNRWLARFAAVCTLCVLPAAAQTLSEGQTPPPYLGVTLDGDSVQLTDYAGKATVVTFWATWCPYCLQELPILDKVQRKLDKANIQIIAVNIESREVFRHVTRALQRVEQFDLVMAHDWDSKARKSYGVKSYPYMLIMGRDGKIISTHSGYNDKSLDRILDDINRATGAARQ